jgi:imidazolonepropionase-like amidohydrolase
VTQYTFEEMKAMVDEAAKLDRRVAAHAHGTEGIKIATRAGVASIEHGSFLDAEGARLMAQRGTYLVPTLMAGEAVERAARNGVLTGLRAEKALAAATAMRNGIKLAVANKVPIALGTDAGVIPHGTNGHEFTLMVEWGGMSPMDAIVAGTMNGAKLLGWDRRLGSLSAGKWADVVAVPGDPLRDIKALEKVLFVMKGGIVVKEPTGGNTTS